MKITVLKLDDFLTYQPQAPAYAVLVFSSQKKHEITFNTNVRLRASQIYTAHSEAIFDKIARHEYQELSDKARENVVPFTENIANKLIDEFLLRPNDLRELVLTDTAGKHRSAGLAKAYNRVFSLGYTTTEMTKTHPNSSQGVYNLFVQTAKRRGIAVPRILRRRPIKVN